MYNHKVVEDLISNNFQVFYFPEEDMYIIPKSYKMVDTANRIYQLQITGYEISKLIANAGFNFTDKYMVQTAIDRQKEVNFTMHPDIKFYYFS